jgi:hypothetical protein
MVEVIAPPPPVGVSCPRDSFTTERNISDIPNPDSALVKYNGIFRSAERVTK